MNLDGNTPQLGDLQYTFNQTAHNVLTYTFAYCKFGVYLLPVVEKIIIIIIIINIINDYTIER